jgi:hypothetical protein
VQAVLKSCKANKVVCAYPVLGGPVEVTKRSGEGFKVMLVAGGGPR